MKKIILSLSLIFAVNTYAQIQISDFVYGDTSYSPPFGYTQSNNRIYFSAGDESFGRELWSSDGTAEDTNLVVDANPGTADGFLDSSLLTTFSTELNNRLYYVANVDNSSQYSGGEIWKTNETGTGASIVLNYTGKMMGLTTVNNEIFFLSKTDDYTLQVWKTDGTQSGMVLVKDNIAVYNGITFQGALNGKFVFTIQVYQTNNSQVWSSDGTTDGTLPLTGEIDGNGSATEGTNNALSQYITYNSNLYFVSRYHLHKTDGTAAGTSVVADLWNAQTNLVDFSDAIVVNNKMYFLFYSKSDKKISIYESDGTNGGTSLVYTRTAPQYFYPSYLANLGNKLFFTSSNENSGTSLFSFNTDSHIASEKLELAAGIVPGVFLGYYSACKIDHITGSLYYVSLPGTATFLRSGWIYNEASNTISHFEVLDYAYGLLYNL